MPDLPHTVLLNEVYAVFAELPGGLKLILVLKVGTGCMTGGEPSAASGHGIVRDHQNGGVQMMHKQHGLCIAAIEPLLGHVLAAAVVYHIALIDAVVTVINAPGHFQGAVVALCPKLHILSVAAGAVVVGIGAHNIVAVPIGSGLFRLQLQGSQAIADLLHCQFHG